MKVLYIILGLIGSILLLGVIVPKKFTIETQVTINKPRQDIFEYVKLIKNQEYYSVRVMRDPNVQMTYSWVDGTVGFVSAWVSNDKNVGVGEQEIKSMTEGEKIDVEIRFKKPFASVASASMVLTSISDTETLVTDTYYGDAAFPMNLITFLFVWGVKKDMQKNLDNLKIILEK